MEGQIPREVSNERFKRLTDLENEIAQSYSDKMIGKTIKVLSDGINKNGAFCGRSSQNKIVTYDSFVPEGTFVNVNIEKAGAYALDGKIVK